MIVKTETAQQVNAVSIETPHGLRTFELFAGDIFSQPADLLVISTSFRREKPAQLVLLLKELYGFEVDLCETFINFGEGVSACFQPAITQTPFDHLLTMCVAPPRTQDHPAEFYDRAIRSTFAAVAALEFLGHEFKTISLPVLVRKGIEDYGPAVRSLLRHALAWLRQSRGTQAVRYFVLDPDELAEWDEAMNFSLGRTYVDTQGEAVLDGLCREIVRQIDSGVLNRHFEELQAPLRGAVAQPDRLCVQTIAAFGRKLAELTTEQLCRDLDLPIARDLMTNIEAVRNSRMLASWISSYLHSLRVFGNEGVHSLSSKRRVVPTGLSPEDLMSILCAIRSVLRFWSEWRRERHFEEDLDIPSRQREGI
ncbi:MAG: DUF4145 domain-containing protein [Planctomycetota bacterium]|nr:MAG: DUF4145 domain-containing protein [Planctomycetota bacterium]REJ97248.1 MAG: DUF4145 domain-containing protein [Planctomycetota bacterium]REK30302.1 MAG: DUF4145 domain-containing protein [Planctomycetota bacterium]REK31547.1 MAG: DUF4145 domain-containing protein [Planctomycetota bacterium]